MRFPPERPRLCRGILTGWRSTSASTGEVFEMRRPEYDRLVQRQQIDDWCGDIRGVAGFDSPALNLGDFATIDGFADARSRPLPAWAGAGSNGSPTLRCRGDGHATRTAHAGWLHLSTWDGRVFLCTSEEPQRFAAAYRIAGQLRRPVPIRGRLVLFRINPAAVASFPRPRLCDLRRGRPAGCAGPSAPGHAGVPDDVALAAVAAAVGPRSRHPVAARGTRRHAHGRGVQPDRRHRPAGASWRASPRARLMRRRTARAGT